MLTDESDGVEELLVTRLGTQHVIEGLPQLDELDLRRGCRDFLEPGRCRGESEVLFLLDFVARLPFDSLAPSTPPKTRRRWNTSLQRLSH